MNGKENIINKILSDADEKCQKIVSAAEQTAEQLKSQAQAEAESDRQAVNAKAQAAASERVRNRVATAELEARKYALNAKQRIISDCYGKALSHFASLSAKDKQAFVTKLLKKYAEKGETVIVAECDKDVITQKTLDALNLGLTLSKVCHDGQGGVILQGDGYEKDLSLFRVVEYLREQTEGKVALSLFGD